MAAKPHSEKRKSSFLCISSTDNLRTRHFLHGRESLNSDNSRDLLTLQTTLCATMFLLSTSRLAKAHSMIGSACSLAMRLGLHASTAGAGLPLAQLRARSKVFGAVIKMDAYASLILGLPSFIRIQDLDPIVLKTLSTADPHAPTLKSKASAMHFELLRLTMASRDKIFNQQDEEEVEHATLESVEKALQEWTKEVSPLLAEPNESDTSSILIRHELEMSYHFVQMLLFRPFLHYLRIMADGGRLSFNESQHALACIKVASTTIVRSESMMSKGLWPPASWTSFYALFLSTMCLIFLIACHSGTSHPSEAFRKAALGINVLAAYRCTDTCASSCLDVLRLVVTHLSHTVDFDMDLISQTHILCSRQRDGAGGLMDVDGAEAGKLSLAHILISPTTMRTPGGDMTSPVWQSDADKILREAEEMSLMYGFDVFDELSY
jgi:hypothetical protein